MDGPPSKGHFQICASYSETTVGSCCLEPYSEPRHNQLLGVHAAEKKRYEFAEDEDSGGVWPPIHRVFSRSFVSPSIRECSSPCSKRPTSLRPETHRRSLAETAVSRPSSTRPSWFVLGAIRRAPSRGPKGATITEMRPGSKGEVRSTEGGDVGAGTGEISGRTGAGWIWMVSKEWISFLMLD